MGYPEFEATHMATCMTSLVGCALTAKCVRHEFHMIVPATQSAQQLTDAASVAGTASSQERLGLPVVYTHGKLMNCKVGNATFYLLTQPYYS